MCVEQFPLPGTVLGTGYWGSKRSLLWRHFQSHREAERSVEMMLGKGGCPEGLGCCGWSRVTDQRRHCWIMDL